MILLLLACHPAAVKFADSGADLVTTDDLADLIARLDAAEGDIATLQADLASTTTALETTSAALVDADARLDALEAAQVAQLVTNEDLQAAIDALDHGSSSSSSGVTVSGESASTGRGGSGSSWDSIITDVAVDANAGDTVVAWCSLTDASGGIGQYRAAIAAESGTYTDDAEVTGDASTAPLNYSGEALTAPGFWTVPSDGTYDVACQGRYSTAYDVTLLAMVVPS